MRGKQRECPLNKAFVEDSELLPKRFANKSMKIDDRSPREREYVVLFKSLFNALCKSTQSDPVQTMHGFLSTTLGTVLFLHWGTQCKLITRSIPLLLCVIAMEMWVYTL